MTYKDSVDTLVTQTTQKEESIQYSKTKLSSNITDTASLIDVANTYLQSSNNILTEVQSIENAANTLSQSANKTVISDLSGKISEIAVNAVDVFIYDTSKDSDGGAWRYRTTGTSWYNETLNTATRGSRREFPAVAVIVAEATKVTIYDGDDPTMPMWMVFNGTSTDTPIYTYAFWTPSNSTHPISCITAKNGNLFFGVNSGSEHPKNGLCIVEYVKDNLKRYHNYVNGSAGGSGLSIIDRNATKDLPNRNTVFIIASTINDVAITFLPDAPIDPATGLPIPTIAVATDSGISVIKDDSTVVTISFSNSSYKKVTNILFYSNNKIAFNNSASYNALYYWRIIDIPESNITVQFNPLDINFSDSISKGVSSYQKDKLILDKYGYLHAIHSREKNLKFCTKRNSISGWMLDDIKAAWLTEINSIETQDIIKYPDMSSENNNIITGPLTSVYDEDGLLITSEYAYQSAISVQISNIKPGNAYKISADIEVSNGTSVFYLGSYVSRFNVKTLSEGRHIFEEDYMIHYQNPTGIAFTLPPGVSIRFRYLSIIQQEPDRSRTGYLGNSLKQVGIITKTPVATGAELVGYSGFSSTNYLEQPYNPDLDFGTGDFSIMGWLQKSGGSTNFVFDRRTSGNIFSDGFSFYQSSGTNGIFSFIAAGSSTTKSVSTSTYLQTGQWAYFCIVRRNGVLEMHLNGKLEDTIEFTGNISNNEATLLFGLRHNGTHSYDAGGKLSLWRISATAPTADQIKKIYEDEKKLFQPGAKCTLYGSSDIINSLAYDEVTNLLYASTSSGTSVFDGLVRVDENDRTPSVMSVHNGIVVEG